MNKFKVGDRVRVLEVETGTFSSDCILWVNGMEKCKGKFYTVKENLGGYIHLDDSASGWSFAAEWLALTYSYKPHVHCELIKAWADGAEIEVYSALSDEWFSECTPLWLNGFEYRIRPNKTDKELQIEKLEEQAKQLASDITKLKETL